MARIAKDPEIRKNELLDAAEELFRQKGYDAVSVSEIVRKVSVSQGTFYYHFKSKEDMVEVLADRFIHTFMVIVDDIIEDPSIDPLKKIEEILKRIIKYNVEKGYLVELVHREKNAILHQKLTIKSFLIFAPKVQELLDIGVDSGFFTILYTRETAEMLVLMVAYLQELDVFITDKSMFGVKMKAIANMMERMLGIKQGSINIEA
jgi:AcrR family transcriptional regulator